MEKRTEAVSVKMTPGNLKRLEEAAGILWPGALLTKSGLVLGLALLCAEGTIKKRKRKA